MINGFVNAYRDKDKFVHLYFYPGVDDQNNPIYREIDLSNCQFTYIMTKYDDNAVDYKFYDTKIVTLTCNLNDYKNKSTIVVLKV